MSDKKMLMPAEIAEYTIKLVLKRLLRQIKKF